MLKAGMEINKKKRSDGEKIWLYFEELYFWMCQAVNTQEKLFSIQFLSQHLFIH